MVCSSEHIGLVCCVLSHFTLGGGSRPCLTHVHLWKWMFEEYFPHQVAFVAHVLWLSVLCHFCLTTELIFAKCSRLSSSPSSPGVVQAGDYPCVTQQSLVRGGTAVPWSLCWAGHTLLWLGRGEDSQPDSPECSAPVLSFPSHVSGRADQRDAASEQDLGAQSV